MTKVSGQVKWFSNRKGYGFVCSPQVQSQEEVFVHHTSIVSPDGVYRTLVRRKFETSSTALQP
jgi:cold shock CspA family protein